VAAGLLIIGVGLGVVPVDEADVHAPGWVIVFAGATFLVGGLAIVSGPESHLNALFGALIGGGLGAVAVWVAFLGPSEHMSGGVPFLPRSWNLVFGRILFGFGGLIGGMVFFLGMRDFLRGPRPPA
jgi:hypothetical protein